MSSPHQINVSDLSILLIEPSKTQQKVITNHLSSEGIHSIECAQSGSDALASLETYQPDLIISSMYLPDMTATQLVIKTKQSERLKETPFMLISSETRFDALDAIRQAGVVAILPKPFNHEDLIRALRSTLDFIDPEEIALEHYDVDSLRVLVVDDSSMARKHITRVLNNMGINQITHANDGKQGIAIFKQSEESFDLIVTDYNMPEMDGRELIEYIRTELDNAYIPILMVTSEENKTSLNNIQQAGVSGICDKPFEPQTVKEMLFRILDDA
jgi:two-component system chemotaxis response regulator CheY